MDLNALDVPSVEWLVVSVNVCPLASLDDIFLTEFTVAWLSLQHWGALRSLYVVLPDRFPRHPEQTNHLGYTLSLLCRPDHTPPRLTEFGLCTSDALNGCGPIWRGMRERSLSVAKAWFRTANRIGMDAMTDVLFCGASEITFNVFAVELHKSKGAHGLPRSSDATGNFCLVFGIANSIPNAILSPITLTNTLCAPRHNGAEWEAAVGWIQWDADIESRAVQHRLKMKVLCFNLTEVSLDQEHLQTILYNSIAYYPELESLDVNVRSKFTKKNGKLRPTLHPFGRIGCVVCWFGCRDPAPQWFLL